MQQTYIGIPFIPSIPTIDNIEERGGDQLTNEGIEIAIDDQNGGHKKNE